MINETNLLLNNEVKVTSPQSKFWGEVGIVASVMGDGRTLDVELYSGKRVFLDVTLVGEVREPARYAKGEPNLGPDANLSLIHI